MAAALTSGRLAPWNPLRCTGTPLPAPLLLAAKIVVLGLLLKGYVPRIPGIFVPMWPALDGVPEPELVRLIMQGTVAASGVLLLCNRAVRTCALLIGGTYLFATLASRGFYSNGRLFCSCILVLIGLWGGPRSIWPIRWQLVVLYAGAGTNKLTQADWRSGWYFEHWMHEIVRNDLYAQVASWLPPMTLSWGLCWATIVTELSIAAALAVPRAYRAGIGLALLFHLASVAFTGYSFGIFVIAVSASLLAFVEWPRPGEMAIRREPEGGLLRPGLAILRRLDLDGALRDATRAPPGALVVEWRGRAPTGLGALAMVAFSLPATYLAIALGYILPSLALRWAGITLG